MCPVPSILSVRVPMFLIALQGGYPMLSLLPTPAHQYYLCSACRRWHELTAFPGWQHPCEEPAAGSHTIPYLPLTWFTAKETFAVNTWFGLRTKKLCSSTTSALVVVLTSLGDGLQSLSSGVALVMVFTMVIETLTTTATQCPSSLESVGALR